MSFLGGLLGGLLTFGAGAGQTALQYAMSKAGQERQYNYQRLLNEQQSDLQKNLNQWNAQNIPAYARQGMESAGFNPILAINSGSAFSAGGSAQGGSAASPSLPQQADLSGIMNGVSNAYKTFNLDKKLNAAQIDEIESIIENTNAKTLTEGYNQQLMQSQYLLNQINTELARKDLSWKDRMYLMQEKTGYMNAAAAHLNAEANQLNANTAVQNYKLDKEMMSYERDKQRIEKAWREKHPHQASWQSGIGQWTGAFGNIFSGSGSKLLKK